MTGAYRMSKRMAQTFCADVLGVSVCAGQVCASEAETAAATDPVVKELRDYMRGQPANVDETGWWQKRQRGWLWAGTRSRAEGDSRSAANQVRQH
jgi:transposase